MIIVIKGLLLASVLLMIFIPTSTMTPFLYLGIFAFAMVLVYFYWRLMYWVSDDDTKPLLGTAKPFFSIFVGKVPAITSEDLIRGRMIITDTQILLFQHLQKPQDSQRTKLIWSIRKDDVQSLGFGKVVGARKGFILYLPDDDSASFTSSSIVKRKAEFYQALGWPVPADTPAPKPAEEESPAEPEKPTEFGPQPEEKPAPEPENSTLTK